MTIVYIGDSFCAQYANGNIKARNEHQGTKDYSHIDMAAEIMATQYVCHGYAGASWWYSYKQFKEWIPDNMDTMGKLTALVFFHTNPGRINTDRVIFGNSKEYENYVRHYHSTDYNVWAQKQYFRDLGREWHNVKTIHFACFDIPYMDLLPGVVYTTPLFDLSVSGVWDGGSSGWDGRNDDPRPNHFGLEGNRRIAESVVSGICQYKPGQYQLD